MSKGNINSIIIRQPLFLLSITCMMASMIMTTCFILLNSSAPKFETNWFFTSTECWLFLAKIILGCSVTAVQGAALVALRRSDEAWYHWSHFAYVFTWVLALTLSVYITILTLHAGLEQGTINAKNSSIPFQNLLQRRETIVEDLKEKQSQQREMFKQKWWTKGNQWYATDIKILEGQLRVIDDKIENFDKKSDDEYVSGNKTYADLAADMQLIFNWNISRNRLAMLLKYFYLLTLSLSLDLGGGLLMMFSVGDGLTIKKKKNEKPQIADTRSKVINFAQADAEEIRLMLPTVPCILDVLNTWKTRLFFYGGSGGGKTTAVLAYLNKMSGRMNRTKTHLFIVDPKPEGENPWPTWAKKIVGRGYNTDEIRKFLTWVKTDLVVARSEMSVAQRNGEPDVVILVDEILQLTRDFKERYDENFADYWAYFLTYTRSLKIYLLALSQSDRVGSMGLQGMGDIKNGFQAKMHFVHEGMVRHGFRYVIVERQKQRDRLFQTVPVSIAQKYQIRKRVTHISNGVTKFVTGMGDKVIRMSDRVTSYSDKDGDMVTSSDKVFVTGDKQSDKGGDKKCHPIKSDTYDATVTKSDKSDTVTKSDTIELKNIAEKGVFEQKQSDIMSPGDNGDKVTKSGDKSDKFPFEEMFHLKIDTADFKYLSDSDKQKEILKAYLSLGDKGSPTGAVVKMFGNKNKTMVKEAKAIINAFNNNGGGN